MPMILLIWLILLCKQLLSLIHLPASLLCTSLCLKLLHPQRHCLFASICILHINAIIVKSHSSRFYAITKLWYHMYRSRQKRGGYLRLDTRLFLQDRYSSAFMCWILSMLEIFKISMVKPWALHISIPFARRASISERVWASTAPVAVVGVWWAWVMR